MMKFNERAKQETTIIEREDEEAYNLFIVLVDEQCSLLYVSTAHQFFFTKLLRGCLELILDQFSELAHLFDESI
jgi:hypothetical protein